MTYPFERAFALVLGIVLLIVGILGFIPFFAANGYLLDIFRIDGVHNLVHILSGIVGIACGLANASFSRLYAGIFGVVYAIVAIVGFIEGNSILGLFAINGADNWLHVVIALASLAVFAAAMSRVTSHGAATVH